MNARIWAVSLIKAVLNFIAWVFLIKRIAPLVCKDLGARLYGTPD